MIYNVSTEQFLAETSFWGVGDTDPQPIQASQEWSAQTARYNKALEYFSGMVFNERSDKNDPDASLLYPLGINLVKMMGITQAASLWGQWEDDLVDLTVRPLADTKVARDRADEALEVIKATWDYSRMGALLYESGLSQQTYGGIFFKNSVDPQAPHGVRIDKLMPYNVFPIWHPIVVDRILEAWIVIPIDRREAELAYGVKFNSVPEETVYVEHWTERDYETLIGDKPLEKFSGQNPWGKVPIEYIPRLRQEGFYGLPLAEDLFGLQDELNARLADIGDNINNAAHPIRWIRNYNGNPKKDFQMGADALWDLGRTMPGADKPEAGVLEAQPEPGSSFNFIQFMLDMTRYSSFTSPVAFGEDEGSQRSGVTLELRLWPMLQQAKATRIYYRSGLLALHRKILEMAAYREPNRYSQQLSQHVITPNFAPLVPRDRQMLVDEICRRAEQALISPEEALARLGVQVGTEQDEIERIREWLEYKAKTERPQLQPNPNGGLNGGQSTGQA
jgi:hypothetical protein